MKQTIKSKKKDYSGRAYMFCMMCGDEWHEDVKDITVLSLGQSFGGKCKADGNTCRGQRIIEKLKYKRNLKV